MNRKNFYIALVTLFFQQVTVYSQDLEPRFLSSVPLKMNFCVAAYAYSSGNILLDNSIPIENLQARINSLLLGYARSMKIFNKLAKFDLVVPYSFGYFQGAINSIDSSTSRNGFGDPLVRLSFILVGEDPLDMEGFLKRGVKKFKLGVTTRLRLPLGQYDSTKLINLGANRWALKLGVAASYKIQKNFILEGQLTSWLFSANNSFYGDNTVQQKPLFNTQVHTTYIFKPGIWVSVSLGNSSFGETVVNGEEKDNIQNATRFGGTFAYRLNKSSTLKMSYINGLSTRYGANFSTYSIAYQFMWLSKR